MLRIVPTLLVLLTAPLAGCELVADFDRDKIPREEPDAGGDGDGDGDGDADGDTDAGADAAVGTDAGT